MKELIIIAAILIFSGFVAESEVFFRFVATAGILYTAISVDRLQNNIGNLTAYIDSTIRSLFDNMRDLHDD